MTDETKAAVEQAVKAALDNLPPLASSRAAWIRFAAIIVAALLPWLESKLHVISDAPATKDDVQAVEKQVKMQNWYRALPAPVAPIATVK